MLAALHSGVIQLWDYRMGSLLDRFDEHDGPVRGVAFHQQQPLFVSGGDDYKIKVWNYKLRRCLFTLLGHLDYIRTVEFHAENPWVLSASDDQTVRVWNWQSRQCLAVLTGHNHYVMCASFHLRDSLVVSASLDQTVRVWDLSGLKKRGMGGSGGGMGGGMGGPGGMGGAPGALGGMGAMPPGTGGDDMRMNADLFGGGDAVVKYVLEGHDRGVNWASFHPSLPLIVSGADDRQVKLWRMNDTKAWEVDTLRGHMNNVSCVMFHARQDLIVSNSEDKTIRVWDMSKRTGVQTLRREHDRFWILAVHPEVNLLAAGHDTGMLVFKLERERPVYSYVPGAGRLLYVKDRYLRQLDLARQDDVPMLLVRRGSQGLGQGFRSMSFNTAENLALLQSDADGGTYELVQVPKDASRTESLSDGLRSQGRSAVFVARNRFAVLDPGSNSILVKNLQNETTKRVPSPCGKTEAIHYGGTGTILVKGDDKVVLFDIQQRLVVAEAAVPGVKYVVWSDNLDRVALLSKHSVTIADRKLGNLLTAHETMRVKSAAWCRSGVLLYATLNHLKYCLPNGDCGTVQTLPTPVYLTRVEGNVVHCLDRECRARALRVDDGEYRFKLALLRRDFNEVVALIKANRLCGQAIIAYLQQRGFPEVALHFVEDAKVCFTLAVQCGNVEVALRAAAEVDAPETWYQLGVEALRQGNFEIVEFCYQKTHNFERLTFLYLITGELEKLEKMMKIAEMKGRVMDWFHSALYLGDVRERIRILQAAGQLHLAAAAAKAHGLDREGASKTEEEHDRLASLMARVGEAPGDLPQGSGDAKLLMPPCPVSRGGNWPLLSTSKGALENALDFGLDPAEAGAGAVGTGGGAGAGPGAAQVGFGGGEAADDGWGMAEDDAVPGDAWAVDDDASMPEASGGADGFGGEEDEDDGWGMEDDGLELPEVSAPAAAAAAGGADVALFVPPAPGVPPEQKWVAEALVPAEHLAAGDFEGAARLMNRQMGVCQLDALERPSVDLASACRAYVSTAPGLPVQSVALEGEHESQAEASQRLGAATTASLEQLGATLQAAYQATTGGKFSEATAGFRAVMLGLLTLVVPTSEEADDAKEILAIAAEYCAAMRVVQAQKACKDDPARAAELAAYFTNFNLQPGHMVLALRQAMLTFAKLKNLKTAALFAKRLLELGPGPKVQQQARQVLSACEQAPQDVVELDFDPRNPFVVCAATLRAIYQGSSSVICAYCGARAVPEQQGKLCQVCSLAKFGGQSSGLLVSRSQMKKAKKYTLSDKRYA